jgi:hypothetical protein
MVYLGRLPQYSVPSIWREIRSYKHYMVIGSEAVGHGVQFFDMNRVSLTLKESGKPADRLASYNQPCKPGYIRRKDRFGWSFQRPPNR